MTETANVAVPIEAAKLGDMYRFHEVRRALNPHKTSPFTVHCEYLERREERNDVKDQIHKILSDVSEGPKFCVVFAPPLESLRGAILAKKEPDGLKFQVQH